MSSVVQAPYGRRPPRRRPHATFLSLSIAALASSPLVAGLHLDLEEQVSIASQADAFLSRAEASSQLATRGLIDDADNYLEQAKSQFIDAFIEEVAKYKEEAYKAKQMAEREMQEELRKMEEEAQKKSTDESARRQDMVEKMNREGDEMKKMLDELKDMPVALEAIASRSSDPADCGHLSFSGGGRKQNKEPPSTDPLPKESPKDPPPQHSAPSGDASKKGLIEDASTQGFPMLQLPAASAVALAEASNLLVPAASAAALSVPAGAAAQMAGQKAASDAAAQIATQKASDGLLTPPLSIGATGVNVNSPPWVLRDSLLAVAAPANAAS